MKLIIFLLITQFTLLACSNEDTPKPGCFQEENRRIVATVKDAIGTIRENCSNYTIEPEEMTESRPLGLFYPCNITREFEIDEARIIFSGYVYESFDTEDICADFFEITEIRFIQ
ncbi:MAG: hypothetical protein AB8B59_14315 [Maribacter sp.]